MLCYQFEKWVLLIAMCVYAVNSRKGCCRSLIGKVWGTARGTLERLSFEKGVLTDQKCVWLAGLIERGYVLAPQLVRLDFSTPFQGADGPARVFQSIGTYPAVFKVVNPAAPISATREWHTWRRACRHPPVRSLENYLWVQWVWVMRV